MLSFVSNHNDRLTNNGDTNKFRNFSKCSALRSRHARGLCPT